MDLARVYRLRNPVQHYAWGSRTAIPELLGEKSPAAEPCAELWLGAHPKAPSEVLLPEGPVGLDALVARDPVAILGPEVARRFGGALPFLFKVLAADAPLSLQAHPSLEQAREGFARENRAGIGPRDAARCYADANHKPELICALGTFHALDRFRDPADALARLRCLEAPELAPLLAAFGERPGKAGLAALFRGLWGLGDPEREAVLDRASSRARGAGAEDPDPALYWVAELATRYPGDVGALAPLLLNVVRLEPGEAMYLPAGELHSYLSGVGLEVMANSDNVLRGGLTPKHVDLPELLRTLSFESGPVEVLRPQPGVPGESRYATPVEEFALARIEVTPDRPFLAGASRAVEILLCVEGSGNLTGSDADLEIARGSSLLVPATAPAYRIEGEAALYRATVGAARSAS